MPISEVLLLLGRLGPFGENAEQNRSRTKWIQGRGSVLDSNWTSRKGSRRRLGCLIDRCQLPHILVWYVAYLILSSAPFNLQPATRATRKTELDRDGRGLLEGRYNRAVARHPCVDRCALRSDRCASALSEAWPGSSKCGDSANWRSSPHHLQVAAHSSAFIPWERAYKSRSKEQSRRTRESVRPSKPAAVALQP